MSGQFHSILRQLSGSTSLILEALNAKMPIATSSLHPHLPIPLGELSVWQRSVRDHPLLNAGKDEPLPAEADVVIVGSGMCGESPESH